MNEYQKYFLWGKGVGANKFDPLRFRIFRKFGNLKVLETSGIVQGLL
jgi:hypothetical protein